MSELLRPVDVPDELNRLVELIRTDIRTEESGFVLVSGGLDSDVVARLAAAALTPARLKLATVIQDDMNPAHLEHARNLAKDLGCELVEIDLRGVNLTVLYRLASADRAEEFDPLGLLDPARMKCSLRTVVLSSYQDRGYIVLGTSNRTESQLGFFLPFGDGIWHVGPIAHLYKTEVRLLAEKLGTAESVRAQPPSAGFWADQTDREDLGFWLVNQGPIQRQREFTDEEVDEAARLSDRLTEEDVDELLLAITNGMDPAGAPAGAKLGPDLVDSLLAIVKRSARLKTRPTGVTLSRRTQTAASQR
jgi:NAD+ synthase